MDEFFFAKPRIHYPGGLSPALVQLGIVSLPDDNGSGLNEYLLGQPFCLEAYMTRESRDERLGFVNEHIEFMAADLSDREVEGHYDQSAVAIGPGLGREGFDLIADKIIPGRVAALRERTSGGFSGFAQIIIDRVTYQVDVSSSGVIGVMGAPLNRSDAEDPSIDLTLRYLSKAFESGL